VSDHRISVDAVKETPNGWAKTSDHSHAESRYFDGTLMCLECGKPVNFNVVAGHFMGRCCGYQYRASEVS
jgi:hypothetical protein